LCFLGVWSGLDRLGRMDRLKPRPGCLEIVEEQASALQLGVEIGVIEDFYWHSGFYRSYGDIILSGACRLEDLKSIEIKQLHLGEIQKNVFDLTLRRIGLEPLDKLRFRIQGDQISHAMLLKNKYIYPIS